MLGDFLVIIVWSRNQFDPQKSMKMSRDTQVLKRMAYPVFAFTQRKVKFAFTSFACPLNNTRTGALEMSVHGFILVMAKT